MSNSLSILTLHNAYLVCTATTWCSWALDCCRGSGCREPYQSLDCKDSRLFRYLHRGTICCPSYAYGSRREEEENKLINSLEREDHWLWLPYILDCSRSHSLSQFLRHIFSLFSFGRSPVRVVLHNLHEILRFGRKLTLRRVGCRGRIGRWLVVDCSAIVVGLDEEVVDVDFLQLRLVFVDFQKPDSRRNFPFLYIFMAIFK